MIARCGLGWMAGLLCFVLGTSGAAQTAAIEEQLQLELLRLRLQQLQWAQPTNSPLPRQAKPRVGAMPTGAVAQLGNNRLRHGGQLTCLLFSPDSKRLLSGGMDGMLRCWSVATGDELANYHLAQTPTSLRWLANGSQLVVIADTHVQIHDATRLTPITRLATGGDDELDISADGKLIVALVAKDVAHVLEVESGLPKLELPGEGRFALLPDGKRVARVDDHGLVTLYQLAGGKPVARLNHGSPITGYVFSPDGKQLVTGSTNPETVKVWDIETSKLVTEIAGITTPRAWLSRNSIAVADSRGAGIYDLSDNKWMGLIRGVTGQWAVSPDGTKLASTDGQGLRIRLWDLPTGKELHAESTTFPNPALLLPTSDGQAVSIVASDLVYRWSIDKPQASPIGKLPGAAVTACVGGKRLVIATTNDLFIYDDFDPAKPFADKPSRRLTEHAANCRSVAISNDGKWVAYSGDAQRIVIADAATGKTHRVLPTQTLGLAMAFTPDGEKLAVLGRDAYLRLWSVTAPDGNDSPLWSTRIQRGTRGTVAISPNGKRIAASSSTRVTIVETDTGQEVFSLDRVQLDDGVCQHVAFSHDGQRLITASAGVSGAIHVWDVATQSLVTRFTTGYGSVTRMGLFPDGNRIVSSGAEETVTVWDLSLAQKQDQPKRMKH